MRRRLPLLVCLLLSAATASAEFYRWRDATGREHFAQDLSRVPPEHRAAAKAAAAGDADRAGAVSYHHTAARSARSAAPDPAAPAAPAPAAAFDCADLKQQVRQKERVISRHRSSVEVNQRWADDIGRSAFSRRKYELRAEEEGHWLAKAEADLDAFRDAKRRAGVPPGCLRE